MVALTTLAALLIVLAVVPSAFRAAALARIAAAHQPHHTVAYDHCSLNARRQAPVRVVGRAWELLGGRAR